MTFDIALLRHFATIRGSTVCDDASIKQRGDQVWQIDHPHTQRFMKANIQHRQ
jgi:transketolase C-terminal domain/subunit